MIYTQVVQQQLFVQLDEINIELVRDIIHDNPYDTYTEIKAQTSLYPPPIHLITHDHHI